MFLLGTGIKKEESAALFPKPEYIVSGEEQYILYTSLRFSAGNTISNMQRAPSSASGAHEL